MVGWCASKRKPQTLGCSSLCRVSTGKKAAMYMPGGGPSPEPNHDLGLPASKNSEKIKFCEATESVVFCDGSPSRLRQRGTGSPDVQKDCPPMPSQVPRLQGEVQYTEEPRLLLTSGLRHLQQHGRPDRSPGSGVLRAKLAADRGRGRVQGGRPASPFRESSSSSKAPKEL